MKAGLIVAMTKEYEALKCSGVKKLRMSGMGKTNAAVCATEMILQEKPDCIINSGCAGGIDPSLSIKDIVIGSQTAYHDVWCGEGNLRGQIQDCPQRFDASPELLSLAREVKISQQCHFGLICTGDRFVETAQDDALIKSIYPDALACDMESAAIAQVCLHFGVPFLSFRIISDVHSSEGGHFALYEGFWKDVATDSFDFIRQLIDLL